MRYIWHKLFVGPFSAVNVQKIEVIILGPKTYFQIFRHLQLRKGPTKNSSPHMKNGYCASKVARLLCSICKFHPFIKPTKFGSKYMLINKNYEHKSIILPLLTGTVPSIFNLKSVLKYLLVDFNSYSILSCRLFIDSTILNLSSIIELKYHIS